MKPKTLFLLTCSVWLVTCSHVFADTLNKAASLYLQGSYSESINECGINIARDNSPDSALYLAGLNFLRINDVEKAREKLTQVMENFKSSRYLEAAKLATPIPFYGADYAKTGQLYKDMLKANANYPAPYC